MKAIDIAFSCYPVTSLKRARGFYEGMLGLKATHTWVKDDTYGMVEYDIGPGTLAIGAGAGGGTGGNEHGTIIAIEVEDFDGAISTLRAKKCQFASEPMETGVCHMAIITDPDGNRVMIHKRK
jgi:predicted enzyme related to lactoylglutathione lyase